MLLKISSKSKGAEMISFLLHKHPDKLQSIQVPFGNAHIFYPAFNQDNCAVALLLELDAIEMVKGAKKEIDSKFSLGHYVNDKPYVASSIMSVAIGKAFSTAMNGHCKSHPELVNEVYSFKITIASLPVPKGGKLLIQKLFGPLGYQIEVENKLLDERFPQWGESKCYAVNLNVETTLSNLLTHLYVLIPALNNNKHYWVGESEIEKLLEKGRGWLQDHPEKKQITDRYLKNIKSLSRLAIDQMTVSEPETHEESLEIKEKKISLHQQRLIKVMDALKETSARTIVDLGCGEGKLLKLLMKERQFEQILGVDIAYRTLQIAKERLYYDDLPDKQKDRIKLIQGALTYKDDRIKGYDAATLVEVIEHIDEDRLFSLEKSLFREAQPNVVIVTTPNSEYNQLYENLHTGKFRHDDHRFEWDRKTFSDWGQNLAKTYNYRVEITHIGAFDDRVGAPSQMAVFKKGQKPK